MNVKDLKDRVADVIETENPTGTNYYGAEPDQADVAADRKRMEERSHLEEPAPGQILQR